ncbi:hypothetical protein TNCV_5096261 [Trichonephila clavipes]|nr:hypothetical protein TNCV_5096261 [Trichonephila clavipes]
METTNLSENTERITHVVDNVDSNMLSREWQEMDYRIDKGYAAFHSRRESITGESPTSFPEENTTMLYSGFEPEPARSQAEDDNHHTGWLE